MKRLLLDQGLPRSWAYLLNQVGFEVVHVADIGMSRAADVEILSHALAEARVCVTLDGDFHSLLVTGEERGPSMIRIRKEGLDGAALTLLVQDIWPGIEKALNNGAMITITERSVRIRRLPIFKV